MIKLLKSFFPKPGTPRAETEVCQDLYPGDINKYIARHVVLNELVKPLDGDGIDADSPEHVHLIAVGADDLIFNIVRQVILLSHFPNFSEESGANRTKVTILTGGKTLDEVRAVRDKLSSKEFLGNLLKECVCRMVVAGPAPASECSRPTSYIDVELEIVGLNDIPAEDFLCSCRRDPNAVTTVIGYPGALGAKALESLGKVCHQVHILKKHYSGIPAAIDIRMPRRANIVYSNGCTDRNIYFNDAQDITRYKKLLSASIGRLRHIEAPEWDALTTELQISNVNCTDCFPGYLRSAVKSYGHTHRADAGASASDYALLQCLRELSRVEHSRWVVEKLIMGFSPLDAMQTLTDENLSGEGRKQYRKKLKKQSIHIDICPYERLRVIDPDAIKYDTFIILAIPAILASLK